MMLAETSDHISSMLQGLCISSKDVIPEDSNAKDPELTSLASHLYDLKLHLDKSTHLMKQENGILTDIESMRLLEQAAFLESSIHYSLDEAIWLLDVFLFDQLSDSSHVVRPESLLAESRHSMRDSWKQLACDNVIPTFAQLENCYEDVVVGKNLLRKLQLSYYGAQAETQLRQIICLFEAPSLSRLGVRSNVLGCYGLVLSVCRLLNYLEVKGQHPLMQIEELRGDYQAITWTVELRIGLERINMAVADLESAFDLNGQNQGAADE
jgi:hypothetical protein